MTKKYIKKYVPLSLIHLWRFFYNKIRAFLYYIRRHKEYHTYAGLPLTVYISDPVSAEWYGHDCDRDEIRFLQKHKLRNGVRVFDIGAHQGVVALILSKIAERSGEVIAVEMNPNHVTKANINRRLNNATNLKILHTAISEENGHVFFDHDRIEKPNHFKNLHKVRSISIDNLTKKFDQPSVIYMDIEGYEYNALKGAKKTLRLPIDWCIEVHVRNGLETFDGSVKKMVSFFSKSRFKLYTAPATDKCHFVQFNHKKSFIKNRFYLIAINRIR